MKLNDKSKHPEWGTKFDNLCYIDKKTTKLVIGTMPPYDICKQSKGKISLDNFFYCSKDNWFWRIVDSLINKNYENYVKDFCKEYNVGFCDIVKKCYHNKNKNGNFSASDEDLLSIEKIELLDILKEYNNVDTIFCTSYYTIRLLKIYYASEINEKEGFIYFNGNTKKYKLYHLKSPSGKSYFNNKNKNHYIDNYEKLLEKKDNGN